MDSRLVPAGWLDSHQRFLWWLIAYLLVVIVVAALAQHFGTPVPSSPLGGSPGSD